MKFAPTVIATFVLLFGNLGMANDDEAGGLGCYASGADLQEDNTFCVYSGAGLEGAKCKRVIPLNEDVSNFLRANMDNGKSICLWGSWAKSPKGSGDVGNYFIYRAELKK